MIAATSTTVRDPEFDQFDREHFEALADLKADTCHGCGGLLSETTVDDGHGYDVDHSIICFRCAAITRAQKDFDDEIEKRPKVNGWHLDGRGHPIVPSARLWTARHLPPPPD